MRVQTAAESMNIGWTADATAQQVTQMVVQEVAKYIRSSERFVALVSGLASRQEAVAAVTKFSVAP